MMAETFVTWSIMSNFVLGTAHLLTKGDYTWLHALSNW